jgi:hypothetical protein
MADSALVAIAQQVIEKTQQRRIDWKQLSQGLLTADFGGNRISLQKGAFGQVGVGLLTVFNSEGVAIASLNPALPDENEVARQLLPIYNMALRQVLKVDESLQNVLTLLKDA